MNLRSVVLCALVGGGLGAPCAGQSPGAGWTVTRIDVDVHVGLDERRLEYEGVVRARLDHLEHSSGPTLHLNVRRTGAGDPALRFTGVECDGAEVELARPGNSATSRAHVRFPQRKGRGDEVEVRFSAVSDGQASHVIVDEQIAIACWTTAWLPFAQTNSTAAIRFDAAVARAPGCTRLHLPAGWVGIVDGELRERRQTSSGAVEVWETPEGVARGFAAGPYEVVTERVNDLDVRVYMLSEDTPLDPKRLARLIADAMAAQEERLGRFPFASYAVVERPSMLPAQTWYASSQQTFILADSRAFDYDHGNLPLWAHEMSHGWWGNTVASSGPGSKWCGESLAQLGALIAIESLEGPAALREFLGYSRSGYSPGHCASGYFRLLRQGRDEPLARMGQGGVTHELSDSKGVWVYHMLRQLVGDEVFFGVLRGVITELAQQAISVAEMRRRFVEAAPEHDLETFFAQWLDRTGAPILDVDWFARTDGTGLALTLHQVQAGEPFVLALDVEVELADGRSLVETLPVRRRTHRFVVETPARPKSVALDPDHKLLIWRPSYGPRPGDEVVDARVASAQVLAAAVGTYRVRGIPSQVTVFRRDGSLYLQIDGEIAVRLVYQEGQVFRFDKPGSPSLVEFDLSESPALSLTVTTGSREVGADRIHSAPAPDGHSPGLDREPPPTTQRRES